MSLLEGPGRVIMDGTHPDSESPTFDPNSKHPSRSGLASC